MANSLPMTTLTFTKPLLHPQNQCSIPIFSKNFQPEKLDHRISTRQLITPARVVSKTNETVSSSVRELEKEEPAATNKQPDENEDELAKSWRKVHGEDDWAGMLDPMDPLLRKEIIRYGVLTQATYDSFDSDPHSKYFGSCKFPPREFFEELLMPDAGYDVTRYLYATSNVNLPNFFKKSRYPKVWSNTANWMGYVAVSNDEMTKKLGRRDVFVAWRGTITKLEWIEDLKTTLRPIPNDKIPCPDPKVRVESGFLDLYTTKDASCKYCRFSAREQVLSEINRLINEKYADEEVSITISGHSLGGALSLINAYDIAETGVNKRDDDKTVPICVFTFGGPRVGNFSFKARLDLLGIKVLRMVNVHDVVPKSPGFLFNENMPDWLVNIVRSVLWIYSHAGKELELDHKNSPFLRPDGDLLCAHNLEGYLHMVDGYHGRGERFMLANGRDYALVNKSSDFLKDDLAIAPNWRQDDNKGMILNEEGRWIMDDRTVHPDHPEDMHHHIKKIGIPSDGN